MSVEAQSNDLFKRAESEFRKEKFAEVIRLLTEIIQINPDYLNAFYLRAQAKFALENPAGAIEDLSSALMIDPNYVPARIKRAEYATYIQMNDLDVLLDQLPTYFQNMNDSHPNPHHMPSELTSFGWKLLAIFEERARQAEREDRLKDAVKYWQAYYDCGGTIDSSRKHVLEVIEKLTWLISARNSEL